MCVLKGQLHFCIRCVSICIILSFIIIIITELRYAKTNGKMKIEPRIKLNHNIYIALKLVVSPFYNVFLKQNKTAVDKTYRHSQLIREPYSSHTF